MNRTNRPNSQDANFMARTGNRLATPYAELHRAWAKVAREAHAFVDANFAAGWRRGGPKSPAYVALKSIYARSGHDVESHEHSAPKNIFLGAGD
jgi:hypothetical protein